MNEFLAELYNTESNVSGETLEKNAAAEFLVKLAQEEGVNLNNLTDEEIGELLTEVEKSASGGGVEIDEEAKEKLAEADFLGRTMAHAYVDELAEIEKQAAGGAGKVLRALGRGAAHAGEATGVSGVVRGLKGRGVARSMRQEAAQLMKKRPTSGRAQELFRAAAKAAPGTKKELSAGAKRLATRVGLPAAGLAATYGASRIGREKRSYNEVMEEAARERAYEMLEDAGYDVEKIAQVDVDTRALQMLEEAGYEVQWN